MKGLVEFESIAPERRVQLRLAVFQVTAAKFRSAL